MLAPRTARDRALAAADFEVAIAGLREPLRRLQQTTQQAEQQAGVELGRAVDILVARHLVQVGLAPWLERKLTGPAPVALSDYVDEQHARVGVLPVKE
jgi:hypothetical protein